MIRISDLGLNIYSSFGRLTFTRNEAGSHYQGAGPKDLGFTACGLVISRLYWGFGGILMMWDTRGLLRKLMTQWGSFLCPVNLDL
jgi:hypothetical protein